MNHAKVVVRAVPPELDDTLRRAWMRGPDRGRDTRLRCWVYIGSANFSKAAVSRLERYAVTYTHLTPEAGVLEPI
eukprot:8167-Eustigmatos_ZCMA.PRE.1